MSDSVTTTETTRCVWIDPMYHHRDGSTSAGWFAEDTRFPGAWGEGATRDAALDDFCEVLRDWWQIKAALGHDDLPPCQVSLTAAVAPYNGRETER